MDKYDTAAKQRGREDTTKVNTCPLQKRWEQRGEAISRVHSLSKFNDVSSSGIVRTGIRHIE